MATARFYVPTSGQTVTGFVNQRRDPISDGDRNGDGLNRAIFKGTFTFDGNNQITGGTLNSITSVSGGDQHFTITGLTVPALSVKDLINNNDLQGLVNAVLTGNDVIIGSTGNDNLVASGPNDTLGGNGGTDTLRGIPGQDTTALIGLARLQATVAFSGADGTVTGPGITDTLTSIARIRFIDGTLAYGANTPEAQAARLYQAAFARAPDASGLGYWAGVLQGGTSLSDIAAGFLAGAEFQARYGTLDNTGFVNALYQNVLGRAADASGSAFWTGALASGTSRVQALASFSESAENKTDTAPLLAKGLWAADPNAASAARLFYATLGRAPDAAGLSYWTTQLESGGTTLLKEADLFVTSAEFTSHYGSLDNAGFVNLLYHNVLGRAADAAGLAAWTTQLAQGTSRTSIVLSFSESTELKARLYPVIEQNGIVVA